MQGNTYDCGVFLCQNAEQLARKAYANSRQEDMPYFRRKMMQEIFVGHLIETLSPYIESQARKSTEKKTSAKRIQELPNGEKKENKDPKKKQTNPVQAAERDKTESGSSRKEKIKWPRGDSKEWEKLDSDLSDKLKYIFSTPEKKAISHPEIIYL